MSWPQTHEAKETWLDRLDAEADARDASVVRPETSEYDFLLVEGNHHSDGILDTIAGVAHSPERIPDDAFALGVVRVSAKEHRRSLVETPGTPTVESFFFDIHGPLVLIQKHPALRVVLVVLDVYGDGGFDPERDHMVVLTSDALQDASQRSGPYLQATVHGPGRYDAPADEYVDDWDVLFDDDRH